MSKVEAVAVPRPEWAPLPRPGCRGVEFKVLLHQPGLALAMLRFGAYSTIDEHPADFPVDVICLEGEGSLSVDGEPTAIHAGESVRWPPAQPHRLWTEASTMTTLMVEHHAD
jgi:quercetin dioxygenase-like cupin family protein